MSTSPTVVPSPTTLNPFFLALTKQHMQTHSPPGKHPLLALALNDLFASAEKVSAQHNAPE